MRELAGRESRLGKDNYCTYNTNERSFNPSRQSRPPASEDKRASLNCTRYTFMRVKSLISPKNVITLCVKLQIFILTLNCATKCLIFWYLNVDNV